MLKDTIAVKRFFVSQFFFFHRQYVELKNSTGTESLSAMRIDKNCINAL